jgi:flagellar biosynthesis GTPase FlhF
MNKKFFVLLGISLLGFSAVASGVFDQGKPINSEKKQNTGGSESELTRKNTALIEENKTLRADLKKEKDAAGKFQKEISDLKTKGQNVESKLEKKDREIADKNNMIATLNQDLTKIKAEKTNVVYQEISREQVIEFIQNHMNNGFFAPLKDKNGKVIEHRMVQARSRFGQFMEDNLWKAVGIGATAALFVGGVVGYWARGR